MKKCQCCGWESDGDVQVCPKCGEGSFLDVPLAPEAKPTRPSVRPKSKGA